MELVDKSDFNVKKHKIENINIEPNPICEIN